MYSKFRTIAFALALLALTGCAGTNFKKPEPDALKIGISTRAQIVNVMGAPAQTGESLRNGEKLKVLRYAYAEGATTGKYPGVVPARAMSFLTHNDLLVAQEFVSSFVVDATDFDDTKVAQIVKGQTTRSQVVAMLGSPNGMAVHPFIKNKGETAALYSYAHVKGSVFNMSFHSKMLVVSYDGAGVVADVEYTANGEK